MFLSYDINHILKIEFFYRLTLEQQTSEVYKAIEEKMNTAADKRDENIKKMLERLREHVSASFLPTICPILLII